MSPAWVEGEEFPAEALPIICNLIARAVDVGEGDVVGEEPIKTWGGETSSSHFDCTALKRGGVCVPNVFNLPSRNKLSAFAC